MTKDITQIEGFEGALYPHFQPIVEIRPKNPFKYKKTNTGVSLETLARQKREDGSVSSPATFMSEIKKDGNLPNLFRSMFTQAASLVVATQIMSPDALDSTSVNLDRETLLSKGFINFLEDILHWYDLKPTDFKLELLETVFKDDISSEDERKAIGRLKEIQNMGIPLSFDDFGAGANTGELFLKLAQEGISFSTIKIDGNLMPSECGGEQPSQDKLTSCGFYDMVNFLSENPDDTTSIVLERASPSDHRFFSYRFRRKATFNPKL